LLAATWPEIEIKFPEVASGGGQAASIQMYYSENRIDRELYWSGFGFQVWLQMLTHMLRGARESVLILDEPDIYLHPDLQRKLLRVARERFGQYFLATHSIEIINEADPGDVLSINSNARSAKRVQTDEEYQSLFKYLGSVENIDFARLGRARRLIFFEGNDKKILRRYAAKLGATNFANDPDTMILQSGGFSQWRRVKEVAWTFKEVLKIDVGIFSLFDRDYRSQEEIDKFLKDMEGQGIKCHILHKKGIENYSLTSKNLVRAIRLRQQDRLGASHHLTVRQIERLIDAVSNQFKHDTSSQIVGQRIKHYQEIKSKIDPSTVSKEVTTKFEKDWKEIDRRLGMLAGKDFISQLSARLQKRKGFSITTNMLIDTLPKEEIPSELTKIIMELDAFCTKDASKSGD
jgi:predicted ATP-dependent endonuclease of OLD family